jgi:hypothetical protein
VRVLHLRLVIPKCLVQPFDVIVLELCLVVPQPTYIFPYMLSQLSWISFEEILGSRVDVPPNSTPSATPVPLALVLSCMIFGN